MQELAVNEVAFSWALRDPQTGKRLVLTVIGVLSDSSPEFMAGIWTSQATLAPVFGDRVLPTTHLFSLRPGVDAAATAKKLESAFLAHGMQADFLKKLLDEAVSANLTFDRLIEGFMGLVLAVYLVALLTTFIPALRASRIYPAEALRYQ